MTFYPWFYNQTCDRKRLVNHATWLTLNSLHIKEECFLFLTELSDNVIQNAVQRAIKEKAC